MRRLFRKKIILWTVGIVGVLIIGSVVAMNYATEYVLRSMLESAQVQNNSADGQPDKNNKLQSPTSTPSNKPSGTVNGTVTPSPTEPGKSGDSVSASTQQTDKSVGNPQESDSKVVTSVTPPSENPSSTPTGTPVPQKENATNITPDKIEEAQESITLREKAKVSTVLLKKLSPSDISLFMKMSGDGVTVQEKKEAKQVILQKLSEDEYNELIAIAAKLGLSSSGKDYKASQK